MEAWLTIDPAPLATIVGSTAFIESHTPVSITPITRSQSLISRSMALPTPTIPALQ